MSQVTEQRRRIEDIRAAKYITGALRDISAIQLKDLREKFETNKTFYVELRDLFQIMWRISKAAGLTEHARVKNDAIYVAFTTNRHFYGALNHNVMRKFMSATDTKDQCLIIGETGKQIWLAHARKRRELSFLTFKHDIPDNTEIVKFLEQVADYQRVHVFYPGFVSVFDQTVEMLDITFRPSDAQKEQQQQNLPEDVPQYLLEPDIKEMSAFFSSQVRYVLFERMLLETQLSQVAARLVKMDVADQNANELINVEQRELRRAFSSFSSRRMLETLVGYLQWHNQKPQHIVQ